MLRPDLYYNIIVSTVRPPTSNDVIPLPQLDIDSRDYVNGIGNRSREPYIRVRARALRVIVCIRLSGVELSTTLKISSGLGTINIEQCSRVVVVYM